MTYSSKPRKAGAAILVSLLAAGVLIGDVIAGDIDLDGVDDAFDNCSQHMTADQRDTDGDGFGNRCDADFDQSSSTNFADLATFRARFGTDDADANLDGIGAVNFGDLAIFRQLFGRAPGPGAVPPVAETGLDFPSNEPLAPTVRFRFVGAALNSIYPATYIWRIKPRQQTGLHTTFYWANDGEFYWGSPSTGGDPDSYYGTRPYPQEEPGTDYNWVTSVAAQNYRSADAVQYDRWYQQALVVWNDNGLKRHDFYYDLPDTSKVVSGVASIDYGNETPPFPALTWGDTPWNEGGERLSGVLRGIQIYSVNLSAADVLGELAVPQSTAAGTSNTWYLNINPTPGDISDKSGAGHHPEWVGPERPGLWTSP